IFATASWLVIGCLATSAPAARAAEASAAVRQTIAALTSPDAAARAGAACALRAYGTQATAAIPQLIALLADDTQVPSTECTGNVSIGAVVVAVTTPACEASAALVDLAPASVPPLITAAGDPRPGVRRHAIDALGDTEDARGIPAAI